MALKVASTADAAVARGNLVRITTASINSYSVIGRIPSLRTMTNQRPITAPRQKNLPDHPDFQAGLRRRASPPARDAAT
jgi:hypothetical protein